jgi:hypothetical protein
MSLGRKNIRGIGIERRKREDKRSMEVIKNLCKWGNQMKEIKACEK